MSCRVLQRGVEQLAMNTLVAEARARNCRRLIGRYLPTAKNAMVKDFFSQFGFLKTEEDAHKNTTWVLDASKYVPCKVHITVDAIENPTDALPTTETPHAAIASA